MREWNQQAAGETRAEQTATLMDLRRDVLKGMCAQEGLKVSGSKPVLVERILDAQASGV